MLRLLHAMLLKSHVSLGHSFVSRIKSQYYLGRGHLVIYLRCLSWYIYLQDTVDNWGCPYHHAGKSERTNEPLPTPPATRCVLHHTVSPKQPPRGHNHRDLLFLHNSFFRFPSNFQFLRIIS